MPNKPAHTVLIVDDVQDNITLLEFDLEDDGFDVTSASNGKECLEKVKDVKPSIILLDVMMPIMNGIETLNALKADPETVDIPVLMLSASDQEEAIIAALDLGAHDYVSKPFIYEILSARMRSALRLSESQQALEEVNGLLKEMAYTDPLTKLYNRRHFFERSETELGRDQRSNEPTSVIMLDIDRFKSINDNFGHAAGDFVLVKLADILGSSVRDYDIFGRFGGEEFIVCCPSTHTEGAVLVAERLRKAIEEAEFIWEQTPLAVTSSFGVATSEPGSTCILDDLVSIADKHLYTAKENGRNRVES